MPHFLNKISALPSQFLKWQPKILLVGQHRRTEKLLPRIKWHNYEKADSHTEAVSRVYDSFLTPNPVDIILLEQEDLFAAKDNLLDFIQKDHHFKNVPVILFISDRQEIQNVELNKKYPLLKYEIIKNKVSKKKLIIALSNSLLAENIQSYRQEKLDRNILINDLFKDHRREKKDWSFKPVF